MRVRAYHRYKTHSYLHDIVQRRRYKRRCSISLTLSEAITGGCFEGSQLPVSKIRNHEIYKIIRQLSLKKETVARLHNARMNDIKGGITVKTHTMKCISVHTPITTIPSPNCIGTIKNIA